MIELSLEKLKLSVEVLRPQEGAASIQWTEYRGTLHSIRLLLISAEPSAERDKALALLTVAHRLAVRAVEEARERESRPIVYELPLAKAKGG